MPNHFALLLAFLFFSVSLYSTKPLRIWTNSEGKTTEAKFLEKVGQSIRIQNTSGKEFTLPLSRLSKKDQDYVSKVSIQSAFLSSGPFGDLYQGGVIIASITGELLVLDPPEINYENSRFQKPRVGRIGDVISVGTQLTTGKGSKAILLFTNGSLFTMGQETKLYIKEFWQEEFEGNEDRVLELEREISASRVTIGLSSGEMIVDVKKLNRTSSLFIEFPLGVAGIRGTQFRLFSKSQIFELGVLEGRVDYLSEEKKVTKVGFLESLSHKMNSTLEKDRLEARESEKIYQVIQQARTAMKELSVEELLESAEVINGRQAGSDLDDGGIMEKHINELLKAAKLPSKIKEIKINGNLKDIRPLEKLLNLETLNLGINKQLSNFSALEKLSKLKSFSISYNRYAQPHHFRNLINLEYLSIYPSWERGNISDLIPLSHLKKIKSLILPNHSIQDPSPLFGLQALEELNLSSNLLTDCNGFDAMRHHLIRLNLSNNKITDATPLLGMKKLLMLDLSGNPISQNQRLELIRALPNCTIVFSKKMDENEKNEGNSKYSDGGILRFQINELLKEKKRKSKIIEIRINDNDLKNLEPLLELSNLESLHIVSKGLNDFSTINKITKLKKLTIDLNHYTKVQYFKSLINLESLSLSPTVHKGGISELGDLSNFKKLNYLSLPNHQIDNIHTISKLTRLQTLLLQKNQIKDIRPLEELRELVRLDLSDNQITDPTSLFRLRKLEFLNISGNPIEEKDIIRLRRAIPKCEISL